MILELIAFCAGAYVGTKYTEKLQWVKKIKVPNPFYQKRIIKVGDKYALEKYQIFERLEFLGPRDGHWYGIKHRNEYCLGTLDKIKEIARESEPGEVVERL